MMDGWSKLCITYSYPHLMKCIPIRSNSTQESFPISETGGAGCSPQRASNAPETTFLRVSHFALARETFSLASTESHTSFCGQLETLTLHRLVAVWMSLVRCLWRVH